MEKPQKQPAAPPRPERISAEAEQLRANLAKRKRQQRLRQFEESGKHDKAASKPKE